MYKRILAYSLIVILLCSSLTISSEIKDASYKGKGITLYVGGSGAGNYSKIQDALDNSSNGDTVFVYNGVYNETIIIDNTINLIGEDKYNIIIEGDYAHIVVRINADMTNFSGFTVNNSDDYSIYVFGDNCNISNNIIENGRYFGVYFHSDYNTVFNNTISRFNFGVNVETSKNNKIIGNIIFKCNIRMQNLCLNNLIQDNIIYNTNKKGIDVGGFHYSSIIDNTITNCADGIFIAHSSNLTIAGNIINQCNEYGIYLGSRYSNVYDNIVYNSGSEGIFMGSEGENPDSYNVVHNNNIYQTQGIGIHINSNLNLIYENDFVNNSIGIRSIDQHYGKDSTIYHNNFINNGVNAVFRHYNNFSIENSGNYWSDYNGTDSDGDGIGDTPYYVPGSGGCIDEYPLMRPVHRATYFSKMWNFISSSYNQSIDKIDIILICATYEYNWSEAVSQGIVFDLIFGWNRENQSYTITDSISPGNGHWIYANEQCLALIGNISVNMDNHITNLIVNWNAISIPFGQHVNKSDVLVNDMSWSDAVTAGIVSDFIFGWGRAGQYYTFADTLMPGYAYWVYAYQPCKLKRTI